MEHAEWIRARNTEERYAVRLRKVARHIADIVQGFDPVDWTAVMHALERYAEVIGPWAVAVAHRMAAEVAARERKTWRRASEDINRNLHQEIDTAPTGQLTTEFVIRQASLIKSLPLEAAQRVQRLAIRAAIDGDRYGKLSDEIMRTGVVSRARANLIARTEIGRVTTALTAERAQHIGSTHFIWRTAKDAQVREWHRALEGKSFPWSDPPQCDPGIWALPGSSPNCRCYAEPIIPDIS